VSKPKYIESPYKMWELFCEYAGKTKERKRVIEKATPRGVVKESHEVPLTMVGFECYVADSGFNTDLSHYFANYEDRYTEYLAICSRIKKSIRQDQIEGGMTGQYNASITQRLNNLTERVDQTSGGDKVNNITVEIVRPNEK